MKKLYSFFLCTLFALPTAYAGGTDYTRRLSVWFDSPNNLDGRAVWYGERPDQWKGESKPTLTVPICPLPLRLKNYRKGNHAYKLYGNLLPALPDVWKDGSEADFVFVATLK